MRFWRISPLLPGGLSLVGERDKFVGVARQRFRCLSTKASAVQAKIVGAANEELTLLFASPELKLVNVKCLLSNDGEAKLTIKDGTVLCGGNQSMYTWI